MANLFGDMEKKLYLCKGFISGIQNMENEEKTIVPERATFLMANSSDDGHRYWFPMRVSYGRCARIARELREGNYGMEYFVPTEERRLYRAGTKEFYLLTPKELADRKIDREEKDYRKVYLRRDSYIPKSLSEIEESAAGKGGEETTKIVDVPLVSNLIFLYGTRTEIRALKNSMEPFTFMRFITFMDTSEHGRSMSLTESWAARRIRVIPRVQMEQFMTVLEKEKNHVTLIPYESFEQYVGKRIRFIDGPFKGQEAIIRRSGKTQNKRFFFDLGKIIVARVDYIPKQQYEMID